MRCLDGVMKIGLLHDEVEDKTVVSPLLVSVQEQMNLISSPLLLYIYDQGRIIDPCRLGMEKMLLIPDGKRGTLLAYHHHQNIPSLFLRGTNATS
jgi:hypothetical protein